MKYLLIIYGNKEKWEAFSPEEQATAIERYEAFADRYFDTGEMLGGYGLADSADATVLQEKAGVPVVTDGPYLESKEYMASFWMVDCASRERALEIAADMPYVDIAPVEVWPVEHESRGQQ